MENTTTCSPEEFTHTSPLASPIPQARKIPSFEKSIEASEEGVEVTNNPTVHIESTSLPNHHYGKSSRNFYPGHHSNNNNGNNGETSENGGGDVRFNFPPLFDSADEDVAALEIANSINLSEIGELDDSIDNITCIQTITRSKQSILSVTSSKKFLFAGASSGDIYLLSLDLFVEKAVFKAHEGNIYALCYDHNREILFSCSRDNTIKCWSFNCDSASPSEVVVLKRWIELSPDCGDVLCMLLNEKEETLWFGCQDGSIQSFIYGNCCSANPNCMNLEEKELEASSSALYRFFNLSLTNNTEHSPTRTNTGNSTSTTGRTSPFHPEKLKRTLRFLIPGERVHKFSHNGFVFDLAWCLGNDQPHLGSSSSEGNLLTEEPLLVSCSGDSSIKFWRFSNQTGSIDLVKTVKVTGFPEPENPAIFCILCQDGLLYAGLQEGGIRVYDLETLACIRNLEVPVALPGQSSPQVLSLCRRDGNLFAGLDSGLIQVWDPKFIPHRTPLTHHLKEVHCIRSTNKHVISCSADKSIKIWRVVRSSDPSKSNCVLNGSSHSTSRFMGHQRSRSSIGTISSNHHQNIGISNRKSINEGESNLRFGALENSAVGVCPKEAISSSGSNNINLRDQMTLALGAFVSIKSVSSDEGCREECRRAAKFLKSILIQLGADVKLVPGAVGKNPLVLAKFHPSMSNAANSPILRSKEELRTSSDPLKAVLFYGHYDVQPADESKEWKSKPFNMTGVDGYLYGRGTTDNKGPIISFAFAVSQLKKQGLLNRPVVMLVEGEEESRSEGLMEAINSYKDSYFGSIEHIVLCNSYWLDDDRPCLTFGLRGVIHFCLRVESLQTGENLHSGVHGGSVVEPMLELVKLLSCFTDAKGTIRIPGFQNVNSSDIQDKRVYNRLKEHLSQRARIDGDSPCAEASNNSTFEDYMKRWTEPNFTIHKIESSGPPGNSTVIPHSVVAHASIRIVPGQDIAQTCDAIQHFALDTFYNQDAPPHINSNCLRLVVEFRSCADSWLANPLESSSYRAAERAIQRVWNVSPLYIREGGSIPAIRMLERALNAQAIHIPLGQASDHAHLPNERLRLLNLTNGYKVLKLFLSELDNLEDEPAKEEQEEETTIFQMEA